MGGGPSLPLAVADSIVEPGKTSIVSDPIPLDYDAFCSELVKLLKYPVRLDQQTVLKECKVVNLSSADDFEVTLILDGAKLTSYGFGNKDDPNKDRIDKLDKIKVDRAARKCSSENFQAHWEGEEPQLAIKTFATFTKDPFRLDYYWELPDGTRIADDTAKGVLQGIVDTILAALQDRKVTIKLDEGKQLYTCDPIDESVIGYDKLFDGLVAATKEGRPGEVEELSANKFKKLFGDAGEDGKAPYQIVSFDKDKGSIVAEAFDKEGKTLSTTTYSVEKSPLKIEVVTEADGKKLLNQASERIFQAAVDGAIKQASSGWFW